MKIHNVLGYLSNILARREPLIIRTPACVASYNNEDKDNDQQKHENISRIMNNFQADQMDVIPRNPPMLLYDCESFMKLLITTFLV